MMAIGMTWDEYWFGDVRMTRTFFEAEEIRRKENLREENMTAWLQGMYIYDAMLRVAPLLQPFSKTKKVLDYMEKPFDIFQEGKEKKEAQRKAEEQRKENERLKAVLYFKKWAKQTAESMKEQI